MKIIEELPGEERLLDKREVARRVRKTTRTVDQWMARGLLPFLKLPGGRRGTVLFQWKDVLAALEKFRVN